MDNQTQINNIASVIQHYKRINGLTVELIISKLPNEYQMSRTGFNAYLHGSTTNPPSRDFFIAILKAVGVPDTDYDYVLKVCGFAPVNNSLRDIILTYSIQQKIPLTLTEIDFATTLLDDVLITTLKTINKMKTTPPPPPPTLPTIFSSLFPTSGTTIPAAVPYGTFTNFATPFTSIPGLLNLPQATKVQPRLHPFPSSPHTTK